MDDYSGNIKGTRYYYWVVPIDTSDNFDFLIVGAAADNVKTGIILTDTDTTLLAAPTGVALTQANRDVDKDGTVDIALLSTFSGGVAGAGGYVVEFLDSAGQVTTSRADSGKAVIGEHTAFVLHALAYRHME